MKIKVLISLLMLSLFLTPGRGEAQDIDAISYETLLADDWTDYVYSWDKLFKTHKINHLLEFGMSYGSKFFLDHCEKVTSIELVLFSRSDYILPAYFECSEGLGSYSNWVPKVHIFSDAVDQANELAILDRNPELYNSEYLQEIDKFCHDLAQEDHYDAVFVDPKIHIRGDLVNALFNRFDIIAAHDTKYNGQCYGWYKIAPPDNYEQIDCDYGAGVTFWIKKDKVALINDLKELFLANRGD